jgi:CDGSH iron-sulfur domain-containing protein 3
VTRQTRRPILTRVYARGYSRTVSDVTIDVRENGPYKVTGTITIRDFEGREFVLPEGSAVALCRCGHSENKPFCDGTHKRIGFVADETAPRL